MFRTFFLFLSIIFSFNIFADSCPLAKLPENAYYDQKTLAFMTTVFRVKNADRETTALIKRRRFNLPKTLIKKGRIAGARFDYKIYQGNSDYLGFKKYDLLSFYGEQIVESVKDMIISLIEVKDCKDKTIGFIRETIKNKATKVGTEILESLIKIITSDENGNGGLNVNLSNVYSEFEILDANKNVVAVSESVKFLNDNFVIKSTDGDTFFTMKMDGWNWDPGADWYIDFHKNKTKIDNRILALMPAFKTYSDYIEDLSDSLEN